MQGLAVGWLLGSFGILAYSMLGVFAWHCLVRPVEERELLERFGEEYVRYRSTTSLWFPSFKRSQKSEIFDR